jgi:hypothetical protein
MGRKWRKRSAGGGLLAIKEFRFFGATARPVLLFPFSDTPEEQLPRDQFAGGEPTSRRDFFSSDSGTFTGLRG